MGVIRKSDKQIQADKQQRIMDGIAFWAGYYRANIEKFCEEYLGIKLKLFQKIILRMMNYNTNFYYIASRGQYIKHIALEDLLDNYQPPLFYF